MPVVIKSVVCLFCCLCLSSYSRAQGIFRLLDDTPQSFKFEFINNAILVPVVINGLELNFLLDTGVKETILFAHTDDSLYLRDQHKVKFQGIGSEEGVEGILSKSNRMTVGNIAIDTLHWIYVIQASDLDISSDVGVVINGILGSKFFNSFPVKIDYIKSKITIYPPGYDYSKEIRRYEVTDINMENDRPYIRTKIQVDKSWIDGKMLVDLGNTDPLMLFSFLIPDFSIKAPYVDEYIGRGMNGIIYGKRNRIRKAVIEDFELPYPIVSYPDSNTVITDRLAKDRIGSVGNQTWKRFHVLIDCANNHIYLKKNKWFKKPFMLNMAGMDIKHDGMIWTRELVGVKPPEKEEKGSYRSEQGITIHLSNDYLQYNFVLKPSYKVSGIRKNSPAEKVGVQVGDILLKINGAKAENFSLSKIMSLLQSHPGDGIKLSLQRGDEIKNISFHLVDPIPYQ